LRLKGCEKLSLERVFKILEGFGFSRAGAIVYIYLAKAGPQRYRDLMRGLRMPKDQLYSELKRLHQKGVVTRSSEHPALFSALAFEELLNLFIKANVEQARALKEAKEDLQASWRSVTEKSNS
jgi:sugar-specific transcriptional regulator TrmB